MFFKQKRKAGGHVTPSFIRSIRKGYLAPNGSPLPGKEREADVLLQVMHAVQAGEHLRGMTLAKRHGFELEKMYRDYSLLIEQCSRGRKDFFKAVQRFCDKHNSPIRIRMAA
jgi:hypothetical protein